jgi:hypothetical protein
MGHDLKMCSCPFFNNAIDSKGLDALPFRKRQIHLCGAYRAIIVILVEEV